MSRHKKLKEVKQLLPPYLTGVSQLFLHPFNFFYIVICSDSFLRIFDIPSMSIIAENFDNQLLQICKQGLKCLFSSNPNIFYLLASQNVIKMYEITPTQIKSLATYRIQLPQGESLLNCELTELSNSYLEVLAERGLLIYKIANPIHKPISITFHEKIKKGAPLAPFIWMLFSQSYVSIVSFHFYTDTFEESNIKIQSQINQIIWQKSVVSHHNNKRLVGFLTAQNFYCIIQYELQTFQMQIIFRIPLSEKSLISLATFFQYGVNTNTSHKYENKILLVLLLEDKQSQEIQIQINNKKREINIFELDLECHTYRSQLDTHQAKQFPIVKQLYDAVSMWNCETISNKLCVLTRKGDFIGVDMTVFLQGKYIAKQWVNLGYKFQALSSNALYEEQPEQFEKQMKENQDKILQKEDLEDWSYSLIPKNFIKNKVKRLNCFQF